MGELRTPSREGAGFPAIDAAALTRALAGGTEALRRQSDAINAINVFPVPDGDTGTNMLSTMRAAIDEVARARGTGAPEVMKAAARGALMGAKGNSGVILSQILAGIAGTSSGVATLDGRALAEGLGHAREKAYAVVSAPKEGTILTAITAAADSASVASASGAAADAVLESAVIGCEDAVRRTPELLPVLKEAGVVDSGAQGLFVLLEGMLRGLRGEEVAAHEGGFGAIDQSWLVITQQVHEHEGVTSGFCTEFVVRGGSLDPDAMREELRAMGESLLVVGGGDVARVHLHTHEPQRAIAYARSLGDVTHEKVDDMEAQFRTLARRREAAPLSEGIAVVAVAAGAGLEELLRSMGATVVHGGPTMNPSAGDIRAAIEASGASGVVVLPNDKNILLAAKLATEDLPRDVRVIETTSVPQGVAALVALNPEATLDENVTEMREAAGNVRTAEITIAARATRLHGINISEGQPIGIIDNELAAAEATIDAVARACVARMLDGRSGPVVTLYVGEAQDHASASALAEALHAEFACDVEVVAGGQPHYPYLIGVE